MSFSDKLTTWQKILGILVVVISLTSMSWTFMHSHFMPRVEASEEMTAIGERWKHQARQTIEVKEDEKIKIKYDDTLPPQAKEELISVREREIKRLNRQITCWEDKQSLKCWRD